MTVDSCQPVQIRSAIADRVEGQPGGGLEVACLVRLISLMLYERRLLAMPAPLRRLARLLPSDGKTLPSCSGGYRSGVVGVVTD
jgi:hypothetical protein